MKVLIILFVVSYIAIAHGLSEEVQKFVQEYQDSCVAESGANEALVMKAKLEGVFEEDPKLKTFFLCFGKKLAFINDNGEVLKDNILERIGAAINEKYAKKLVDTCGDKHGSTPEQTAFEFAKCFRENKPENE